MKKALYSFSGDPITYGHMDIIERAAKVFDKIYVAFGMNPEKAGKDTFSLEERMQMAKHALAKIPSVEIVSFSGMMTDFAYEQGISTIVKGIRDVKDIDYEKILHYVAESQRLEIDTFVLFSKPNLSYVSSSVVKAIQKEHGFVHEFVPLNVKQKLEEKISGQYVVGITGEMGAGKSYISDRFVEIGRDIGIEVHNIDLDRVTHCILERAKEPAYEEIRTKISEIYGQKVIDKNGFIDRKSLGEIVFNDYEKLSELNKVMEKPILVKTRKDMYDKKGVILLNAALISEVNMTYMCNNNVILVSADKKSQKRRLVERNLTDEQIEKRLNSQFDTEAKKTKIENQIRKDNYGELFLIDNSDNSENDELIKTMLKKITGE